MYQTVNAGVIGVGHMGQYHVAAYSEIPGVNLVGVSDLDKDKGRAVAAKYRTVFFENYQDLLDKVDALTIAVPTKWHFDIAKICLEAGKHCLVEKPICESVEAAERLFEIAGRKGVALHVGHVERFNGAVQELRKVVKDPILIESRRLGPFEPRVREDGVVLDLMIHDIDIILNIVNSPLVNLNVIGSSMMSDREDVVNVQMQFASGCMASIVASRATQEKIRTLAITQEKEYIVLDYTAQDILVHRRATSQSELTRQELKYRQESMIERIFVHRENPLKLEIKHLIGCASNGDKRIVSVESELQSLKVAHQVLERLKPVKMKRGS